MSLKEELFEKERINYAYEGKPLNWQQGFDKGLKEGFQIGASQPNNQLEADFIKVLSTLETIEEATRDNIRADDYGKLKDWINNLVLGALENLEEY